MKQKIRKSDQYELRTRLVSSSEEGFLLNKSQKSGNNNRKKFLVLVMVLLSFSPNLFAQFQWGIKLGVNTSTQSDIGNVFDNDGLRTGFDAGIIGRYEASNWLAFKSGIEYKTIGAKTDVLGEDSKLQNNLSYLALPLKAEFSASEKAGFKNGQRLFFATGPYCAYLINAEQKFKGQTSDLDNLNDIDLGWSFELGFEFPVCKSNALQLSVNYDMGLSKIADNDDVRNKSASVNIGFLF
ncbi:porin family protein [Maribellus maritimus]|uniref:porin family protein n=1 Tax=Maribellus maritimus TaxID=2870838 RepID=UPI001EEA9E9B|nr:porin family protein [Maribellus maritimus]MCG6188309.1 PorT family protein [Maribellus maritimus]